jgi:hypothetical protein
MKVFCILLLVLSGCSAPQPPPQATGPWHALNAGRWQPTAAEQQYIAGMPH